MRLSSQHLRVKGRPSGAVQGVSYDADRDLVIWPASICGDASVEMQPRMFAIFATGELHRPMISSREPCAIRKLVVKIDAELMADGHG